MADEIDAAHQRGEVAKADGTINPGTIQGVRSPDTLPATYEELGISRQRVAEWRALRDAGESVIDEAIQAALDEGGAPTNADVDRAVQARHHRTRFTGENEWYTPPEYIEAARACLGAIDVDPASSHLAQEIIGATRFFTAMTTACATIGAGASGSTRRTPSRTSHALSTSCSPRSPPAGRRKPFC